MYILSILKDIMLCFVLVDVDFYAFHVSIFLLLCKYFNFIPRYVQYLINLWEKKFSYLRLELIYDTISCMINYVQIMHFRHVHNTVTSSFIRGTKLLF